MRFYQIILAYPRSVIGLIIAVTLFFGWQASKVELNNSIEAILPQGHPAVLQDREVKHVFNSREMILIGLLRDEGIFNPGTLQKVQDLTRAVWKVTVTTEDDERQLDAWGKRLGTPYQQQVAAILEEGLTAADRGAVNNLRLDIREDAGLDEDARSFLDELRLKLSPVSDVVSLAQVDNITATEYGLDVHPPMAAVPESEEELAALAATVYDNEMFVDGLVSEDSTGTLVLVELAFNYDEHLELAHRLFQKLESLTVPYEGPEEVHLAGVPMVNVYTSNYMSGDLARLMPLVILLVLVVMMVSFRTARGALIPLAVVLVALVWTLGVMALAGRPITLVVSAMPIILIAIGVADGIHLITEYQLLWTKHGDKDAAILGTMQEMTRPIIITSLTDMAGFGSLAISSLASIRDFGIFTSVGVLAALIFSLTCIPAALKLMPPPSGRAVGRSEDRISSLLEQMGWVALRHRRPVVAGALGVAVLAALTLPHLEVGSTMVGYFHEDSKIYRSSQMINAKFGGTEVLNVVVDTGRPGGLKDPEVLGKIAALQDTLEQRRLVGYTTSLADYVKRINRVMNDGAASANRIPAVTERVTETDWVEVDGRAVEVEREVTVSGHNLIAQYLLLYENASGDDLEKLADFEYRKANIVAQIRTDHTPMLREIRQVAQDFARREFGSETEVTFAGCSNLCIVADDLIIPTQLKSLGVALLVVLVLLVLIFRSVRHGLLGMVPLLLTVLIVFALLSLFGVYLDAVTALIASIVLGIGIDYSVHFLARYRALRRDGRDEDAAIRETMATSGRAIVFNSLAVALGFLVLLLSSFWPVMHIGWVVAVTMLVAAVLTLLLLPALLRFERKRVAVPAAASST